ncbi:hypothetical protein MLD38_014031 [Melastoma candidum]|uniref:Uncharacterized protein n=1 Tax=Melastoma candidum TaxID=119954 RepID=A0ACB9RAU4_9MYRT|nr:hypothetical protein MLD38_014031 [Melastoma candidum]
MLVVANAFDLWQKDAFFSAAEEVLESADLMGSTYRAWVREMEQVENPEALSNLTRDLQTALGTAKWQLEEFERAVRLSQGPHGENLTAARHGQFIAAISDQIAIVEAALCRSLSKGDQPLCWINLDKEERDDLALFLSGTPKLKPSPKEELLPKGMAKKFFSHDRDILEEGNSYFGEPRVLVSNAKNLGDGKIDQNADRVLEKEGQDNLDRTVGVSRALNSPSVGDWRIIVDDEDGREKLLPKVELTPKVKGYKAPFWKARCGVHSPPKSRNGLFNKLFRRLHSLHRQSHLPRHLQPSRSVQLMLVMMLMILLIVPFVFFST